MTHKSFIQTIFLGCILVVFSGFARADIVQCVDEAGAVTYTDVLCQNDADVARASVLSKPFAAIARLSSPVDKFAEAEKAREAASAKKQAGNRRLAIDVATLKAARSSMLLMDQAASLTRQKKLAALDQDEKDRRWFSF